MSADMEPPQPIESSRETSKTSYLSHWLPSLIAGLVSGIIGVLFDVSFAAFIFSGELERYTAPGVGIVLFSAIALRTVSALTSSFPTLIADLDSLPTAILATSVAAIANKMPNSANSVEVWLTIVSTLAFTSLLTGAFLLALGQLKLGELIRYIPYPVIGGFLAGTGWLLLRGSLEIVTALKLNFSGFPMLFQKDILLHWLPGLTLAVVLLFVSRRYNRWFIVPASLVAAIGLFYLLLFLTHTTIEDALAQGWLLKPFGEGNLWQPFNFWDLGQVNWSVILTQTSSLLTIVIVSPIAILLNASALELGAECDINLNRELKTAGVANLAVGAGGGIVGYHLLSDSLLVYRIGARSRLVGLTSAGVFVSALVFGASVLSLFPKPVLGGLLLFFGLELLVQWVYEAWFKLPKADYLIVLLIMAIVATVGFVEGVAVGLVVAIILFVINYSQINVAKQSFSGATRQSNVARSPAQMQVIQKKGEQLYILELQSFIFFGTANKLLEQIQRRVGDCQQLSLRFLVLDFRLVRGLDSSAVLSFAKLEKLAVRQTLFLIYTNLPPQVKKMLQQGNCLDDTCSHVLPDLDRGLEWCENHLLEAESGLSVEMPTLAQQLGDLFLTPEQISEFMNYLEVLEVSDNQIIFKQGDLSNGLYFLESGQISVILTLANGQTKRLRTYTSGTIVGEMGLYQNTNRSASVIADQASKLYYLSNQAFEEIEREKPDLAALFHRFIVSLLAERLRYRENELQSLLQ